MLLSNLLKALTTILINFLKRVSIRGVLHGQLVRIIKVMQWQYLIAIKLQCLNRFRLENPLFFKKFKRCLHVSFDHVDGVMHLNLEVLNVFLVLEDAFLVLLAILSSCELLRLDSLVKVQYELVLLFDLVKGLPHI